MRTALLMLVIDLSGAYASLGADLRDNDERRISVNEDTVRIAYAGTPRDSSLLSGCLSRL